MCSRRKMNECRFKSESGKKDRIREFLYKHSDMPRNAVDELLEKSLDNFSLKCDDNEIISSATYTPTDWYLCAIKGLATTPKYRGKGFGTEVVDDIMEKTKRDPHCLVLTSDIRYDNKPSKSIFEKHGFEEVNRFCWGEGEKPADILQLVRFPPHDGRYCWNEKE